MFGDFSNSNEYKELFIEEATEHIVSMNEALVSLEQNMTDLGLLDDVFRSVHTIKGMSAMMGFKPIEKICIKFEDILDKIKSAKLNLDKKRLNTFFSVVDFLESLIKDCSTDDDVSEILDLLENKKNSDVKTIESVDIPTIRVRMDDLDKMVNLVGELTLVKMRLRDQFKTRTDSELFDTLDRLCSELQVQTMKVRLIPLEQAFSRLPRIVRDVSTKLGKEVKFEMKNSDAELDRTVVDNIMDPLLHIIRNSVDHGLEDSEERKKIGKPAFGRIRLNSYRISDKICIEINDDGRGIDVEKIKKLAISKKLFPTSNPEQITDEQVLGILGTPGLSTSTSVTDISGRGVGFNVVRENLRKIGGHLKIITEKNVGTTMIVTLPITISIMKGLVVDSGNQRFVLPLSKIKSVHKFEKNDLFSINGKPVIKLRDKIIPLIKLDQVLNLKSKKSDHFVVLVIENYSKDYGIIVDSYRHKQDIVTSNITNNKNINHLFSNATILEDGNPCLIIDTEALINEGLTL